MTKLVKSYERNFENTGFDSIERVFSQLEATLDSMAHTLERVPYNRAHAVYLNNAGAPIHDNKAHCFAEANFLLADQFPLVAVKVYSRRNPDQKEGFVGLTVSAISSGTGQDHVLKLIAELYQLDLVTSSSWKESAVVQEHREIMRREAIRNGYDEE